jgi:hypothetical protein
MTAEMTVGTTAIRRKDANDLQIIFHSILLITEETGMRQPDSANFVCWPVCRSELEWN